MACIIRLAERALRRQAQGAHLACLGQRLAMLGDQPLLTDALLANQEQEVVGGAVAVQAQALDGIAGIGQVARGAPTALCIEAGQQRLLTLLVDGGDHQAGASGAVVKGFEAPRQLAKYAALAVNQLQRPGGQLQAFGLLDRRRWSKPLAGFAVDDVAVEC
ncbi:hypothetical protein D3C81_981420 [compost metagenome]